jgi:hypothetical protein
VSQPNTATSTTRGSEVGIVGAYANPETRQIFMQEYDPFTYAHEMFHILDSTVLTDADRRRFQRILGMPKRAWNTGTGIAGGGLRSPSEIGADYYAAEAIGLDPSRQYEGAYAQSYNPRRLRGSDGRWSVCLRGIRSCSSTGLRGRGARS